MTTRRWASPKWSAAGMAAATGASRLTGFGRTFALAWALGATALGDAYNVANTAPNMIFQLAAGGVLSSAVVPLLARTRERERGAAAGAIYGVVIAGGAVAMAVVLLAAPFITRVLLLGARSRPEYGAMADVATVWLRLFAAQVPLYGLGVFAVAVMTFHRRLVLGAAASVLTNMVTIGGAVTFVAVQRSARPEVRAVDDGAVLALGLATTAGVAVMAAVQLYGAHRVQRLRPLLGYRDPVVGKLFRLSGWVLLYVIVNQIGLAAVTAMASSVEGGVSAYQWAFTVMQLPYAIVSVSLISAAFPRIAAAAAEGSDPTPPLTWAMQPVVGLLVPAAAVLAALSPAIGVALVGDAGDDLVAAGVAGFAVSLVPFSLFQLMTRTSYAFEDMRTPALMNIGINVVNVTADALAIMLIPASPSRLFALGLGHAASYIVGCVLLWRPLRRHGVRLADGVRGAWRGVLPAGVGAMAALVALSTVSRETQMGGIVAATAGGCAALLVVGGWHAVRPLPGVPAVAGRRRR